MKRLICDGMLEAQNFCVKKLIGVTHKLVPDFFRQFFEIGFARSIERIAENRRLQDGRGMNADLMRSSGLELELEM